MNFCTSTRFNFFRKLVELLTQSCEATFYLFIFIMKSSTWNQIFKLTHYTYTGCYLFIELLIFVFNVHY